jgi:hypothetical protein
VFALDAPAGACAIPPCRAETELVVVVARGVCEIDGQRYGVGDLRIQNAGDLMPAVRSGGDGVGLVLLIADRRCLPKAGGGGEAAWTARVATLADDLVAKSRLVVAAA